VGNSPQAAHKRKKVAVDQEGAFVERPEGLAGTVDEYRQDVYESGVPDDVPVDYIGCEVDKGIVTDVFVVRWPDRDEVRKYLSRRPGWPEERRLNVRKTR
jgi:hypothetical protein